MKRRSLAAATVAVLASSTLLSACALNGSGSDTDATVDASGEITGEVTLQTWSLKPTFTDHIEGVIDAFEAEHPGTEVIWLDQPGDGYSEKVLSQAAAGELPDVTNLPPDFALSLAKEGQLLDISSVDDTLGATYVPGGLTAYEYAGIEGTYGYPWYLNTDVDYWNSDMMTAAGLDATKPPTNQDELLEQARVMKAATGEYLMSRTPKLGEFTAAGIPVLNDAGTEFVFNTPEAAAYLDVYRDAYAEGLLPQDVLTEAYLGNSELFVKGEVAWSTGGGNFIAGTIEKNPSMDGKIVPSSYMGDIPPLYVQGVSVSKSTKNAPAAVALAKFLTNAENQEAFAAEVPGIFPSTVASQTNPDFAESDGTAGGDAKVIAFASLPEAQVLQPYEVTEAMATVVGQQFASAISGQITSQEALDTAVEKCNELLNG